jgi:hypothetical protein
MKSKNNKNNTCDPKVTNDLKEHRNDPHTQKKIDESKRMIGKYGWPDRILSMMKK